MFRLAIMKLTAFCNLNCKYCYMFNQNDRTFTRIDKNMTLMTALKCLERIRDHAWANSLDHFTITLHGGEPTLWPLDSFKAFLLRVDEMRSTGLDLRVNIQTNGYQIRPALLDLWDEHRVTFGVSLDGPREYHDLARVTHNNLGSYDTVVRNVQDIIDRGYKHLLSGFLSVSHPEIPPEAFLSWADELPVRKLDVLWPMEYNYDNPPWRDVGFEEYRKRPRYGAWFADLFDLWYTRDDPTLQIRLFFDCIQMLFGSRQHVDNIVNDTIPIFVVNTDGGIEYHDFFRAYKDGACRTEYNVHSHSLDELSEDPVFYYLLNIEDYLPSGCFECPHRSICGGGFLPGRMSTNEVIPTRRSVLCEDHYYFFSRMKRTLAPVLQTYRLKVQNLPNYR